MRVRVRNMLTEMMSLLTVSLLAITLAATTARAAHLEQSLTSAEEKLNANRIPYYECKRICTGSCICDRAAPPMSRCICNPADIPHIQTADVKTELRQVEGKSDDEEEEEEEEKEEQFGLIPYTKCIKICDNCACTRKLPLERNMCICIQNGKPNKRPATHELEAKESHRELDLPVEKIAGGDFIPYPECIAKCDACTPCTYNFPIEKSRCVCVKHTTTSDNFKKQTITNSGGEDDKNMVLWTKAKLETISLEECFNACEQCTCTRPGPPKTAVCICITPKPQTSGGKALTM